MKVRIKLRYLLASTLMLPVTLYSQWMQTSGPAHAPVSSFATIGSTLFAATDTSGIFLSTDNGTSWTPINTGLTNLSVYTLSVAPDGRGGTNLFAGTRDGVFLSTDKGTSWTAASAVSTVHNQISAIAAVRKNLFAGTFGGGIFRSTNNGSSWLLVNADFSSAWVHALAASGSNIFAGTDAGGVFLSSDSGATWSRVNSGLPHDTFTGAIIVYALAVVPAPNGPFLFAATPGGVFLSTNNGTSWSPTKSGMPNPYVYCFLVASNSTGGSHIFAGGDYGGVFLSTNNGTSWGGYAVTYTNDAIRSLALGGSYLFAAAFGGGVWRRPLSEMTTSSDRVSSSVVTQFGLSQNFPNPFNPSTVIRYHLPRAALVSLKIYNAVGQQVATLVDDRKQAGNYEMEWTTTMPSGVYFYCLQADSYSETKKLILLK